MLPPWPHGPSSSLEPVCRNVCSAFGPLDITEARLPSTTAHAAMRRCKFKPSTASHQPGALAAVMNMVMAGPAVESSHPAVTLSGTPLPAISSAKLQALMSVTRFFAFGATSSVQRTIARSTAASHLECRRLHLVHLTLHAVWHNHRNSGPAARWLNPLLQLMITTTSHLHCSFGLPAMETLVTCSNSRSCIL